MKQFRVRFADTFRSDLKTICLYIADRSGSNAVAGRFANDLLARIESRSFGADSYEPFHPYPGSPEYYRLYCGNYTVFYVIDGDTMDVRRILWSGSDAPRRL